MQSNLVIYSPLSYATTGAWEDFEEKLAARDFTHYASQLLGKGFQDEAALYRAMHKAVDALVIAKMPVTRHFRCVYISKDGQLKKDFLVTDLGFRLIILNADAANPIVARLQVEILLNRMF